MGEWQNDALRVGFEMLQLHLVWDILFRLKTSAMTECNSFGKSQIKEK